MIDIDEEIAKLELDLGTLERETKQMEEPDDVPAQS